MMRAKIRPAEWKTFSTVASYKKFLKRPKEKLKNNSGKRKEESEK